MFFICDDILTGAIKNLAESGLLRGGVWASYQNHDAGDYSSGLQSRSVLRV